MEQIASFLPTSPGCPDGRPTEPRFGGVFFVVGRGSRPCPEKPLHSITIDGTVLYCVPTDDDARYFISAFTRFRSATRDHRI